VTASVTPQCITPGGTLSLAVETEPGAAIGYQAVYSDSGGGGGPPFGKGYGGNDKGFAGADGGWTSAWVVSLKAPYGPARVDVIVGWRGKFGYAGPKLAVADASGHC